MLVTMALLSLIVLALMAVFNSTQNAFRASLTQTDILESGRNAMDLIVGDLQEMTPSYGTNSVSGKGVGAPGPDFPVVSPVNFYVNLNYYSGFPYYQSLVQSLPGTDVQRTNILENFFMLSRQNVNGSPSWVGTGYAVDPSSFPTDSLYRFTMTTNVISGNPLVLFNYFSAALNNQPRPNYNPFTNTTIWSHLMDGVVDLTVRAYDPNGFRMTNTYEYDYNGSTNTFINQNTYFPLSPYLPPALRVVNFYMFSNAVPASVEVQMGVLEDSVLQRAEGLNNPTNYLAAHAAQVHLFRQRVWIRSVDPTAY